jgi:hypothetical protein
LLDPTVVIDRATATAATRRADASCGDQDYGDRRARNDDRTVEQVAWTIEAVLSAKLDHLLK